MITTEMMITSLDELDGPVEGIINVPKIVCWQPNSGFNISDEDMATFIYSEIIENASELKHLKNMNKNMLIKLWNKLYKDFNTSQRWESKFPELKG